MRNTKHRSVENAEQAKWRVSPLGRGELSFAAFGFLKNGG